MNSRSGTIAELKLKYTQEKETLIKKVNTAKTWRNRAGFALIFSFFGIIALIIIAGVASNRSATREIRIRDLESEVRNLTLSQSQI